MSNHNHGENCACGGKHHHHHNHTHGEDCACGNHKEVKVNIEGISEAEISFLKHLIEYHYLPVAQFVVKSSKEHSFAITAMAPVFIIDPKDSMEEVKRVGDRLSMLMERGLITLDYDIELKGYGYNEYKNSEVLGYFKETVEQAVGKDGFLGDIATVEYGSIAPTEKCIEYFA